MDDGKQNTSLYCISSLFWNSLFLIPVLLIIQQIERLKDRIWCLKTGLFFEQLFGVLPSHLTRKGWVFLVESLRFFLTKPLSFFKWFVLLEINAIFAQNVVNLVIKVTKILPLLYKWAHKSQFFLSFLAKILSWLHSLEVFVQNVPWFFFPADLEFFKIY